MNLNFITTVKVTNKFINHMKKNWERIINITSIAGIEIMVHLRLMLLKQPLQLIEVLGDN